MKEYKLNEMEQAIFDVLKDWNLNCSEDDDLKQELARQIEKEVIKLNEPAVSKCDSIERRNLLIDFGNQVVEIQNRYHCILQDVEKEVDAYLKSINNC